ncbi:hypothetical protein [Nocardia jiangsuensis]|uniref:Uncharacterized protein n=1 Tax=Nocardia jiangsuensis TaxID=1691563 RepID=A0ABV8DMK3_9NOCA
MVNRTEVRSAANRYRQALATGRHDLSDSEVERAILWAMIAASAQDVAHWLHTEVPDGDLVGRPLHDLVPELQSADTVGKTLSTVNTALRGEVKSLVLTGAFTQSAVFVWTALAGTVAGFFIRHIAAAGNMTGQMLFAVLFGGAVALGPLVRVVLVTLNGVAHSVGGVGASANRLLAYPRQVGQGASNVFARTVGTTPGELGAPQELLRRTQALVYQVKFWASVLVYGSVALAVAAVLFFLVSVAEGFGEAMLERQQVPTCLHEPRPSWCPKPGSTFTFPRPTPR